MEGYASEQRERAISDHDDLTGMNASIVRVSTGDVRYIGKYSARLGRFEDGVRLKLRYARARR